MYGQIMEAAVYHVELESEQELEFVLEERQAQGDV